MLSIGRVERLARRVRAAAVGRRHAPGWLVRRTWDRLERECGIALEPVLGLLWKRVGDAPGERGARMVTALARNPSPMNQGTIGTAWRRWLDAPSDELWELLRSRARPADKEPAANLSRLALGQAPPEELCAAAIDLDVPEHLRAMLVERCVAQGLSPADPRRRVVFLLLTGQIAQYGAADPDGSLLAAAYQEASPGERARLRESMVTAGDLDLVRVLAGADRTRPAGMPPEERAYLVEQSAVRRDWPTLWRLVPQLPLVEAVAAVRRVGPGWRPDDERGRALFVRLSAATPEGLGARLAELASTQMDRIQVGEYVQSFALSPDGARLAMTLERPETGTGQRRGFLDEYELPVGRRAASYRADALGADLDEIRQLLHTGDAIIVAASANNHHPTLLLRHTSGDGQVLYQSWGWESAVATLAHTRGGFAAVTHDRRLFLHGVRGRQGLQQVLLTDLIGMSEDGPWFGALASEPSAGLLAVGEEELVVIDQDATRVIARTGSHPPGSEIEEILFVGPDQLITQSDAKHLTCWSLDGDTLKQEATAQFSRVFLLTALPRHDLIAARVSTLAEGTARGPVFLDATTLQATAPPYALSVSVWEHKETWSTPTGNHLAVCTDWDTVKVHGRPHPAVLAQRPLAELTPSDLTTVTQAATSLPRGATRDVLELLQACLEDRFATEVALGGQDRIQTAHHDVSLG